MDRRWDRHPVILVLLFCVYVVAGRLSLHLAFFNQSASAFWPPAGIALAAFILAGRGVWPAVCLAAFTVNLTTTHVVWTSALIAVGNTAEAALGSALIDRFAGGRQAFQTADGVFRAAALLGLFATSLGATCGVTTLSLARMVDWHDYVYVWMTWWLGDLTGNLVFAPFILLWAAGPWSLRPFRVRQMLEAAGLLAGLVCVAIFVFGGVYPSDVKTYPLEFLCGPFFLWAAFRFGRREVATAVVVLSGIAVWGTVHQYGPFVRPTENESLMLLQAYMSVTAIISLVVAAVVTDFRAATARLQELAASDPLTGLANYRRLMDVLRVEISRSDRTGREFSLLFVDVNGLKRINDRHGHLAGSRALCQVAQVLREASRVTDTAARFGGDEFVLVLSETARSGATRVLSRVGERLAALESTPAISVSGGVSVYPHDGATPALLLSCADQTLYARKNRHGAGRPRRPSRPEVEPLPDLFSELSSKAGDS